MPNDKDLLHAVDLLQAPKAKEHGIKLLRASGLVERHIRADEALAMIIRNPRRFRLGFTKSRNRLRTLIDLESNSAPPPKWEPCWRTERSAVEPPSIDWLRSVGYASAL